MINNIYQDSRGYIWISTGDGLNRYDGVKFVKYRAVKNDSTSLSSNNVYSVYENVRISKTTDALKSMDSALYYIFRENDKFVKIAMGQPEGFFFSDEKTAEKIPQRIFEHPQFDKSLWTSRKYRKASQILNDITRMPDCSIKYYQENKESFEKRKRQSLLARETALSLNLKRKLKLYFTNPNIVNTRDYEIFESRKYPSSFIIT